MGIRVHDDSRWLSCDCGWKAIDIVSATFSFGARRQVTTTFPPPPAIPAAENISSSSRLPIVSHVHRSDVLRSSQQHDWRKLSYFEGSQWVCWTGDVEKYFIESYEVSENSFWGFWSKEESKIKDVHKLANAEKKFPKNKNDKSLKI